MIPILLAEHLRMRQRLTDRDRRVYDEIWSRESSDSPSSFVCKALERLTSTVDSPRVVDLGCGAGRHALEAVRRGARVTAIDHHPRAIAIVSDHPEVDARHEDFVPWLERADDAIADLVICYDAVHHVSDRVEDVVDTIAQMRRVVAPGGLVVITLLTAVEYSDPIPPVGRLRIDEASGDVLLEQALAGCLSLERSRKEIRLGHACALGGSRGDELVEADYRAVRLLRLVRVPGGDDRTPGWPRAVEHGG